jgi:hypothetical protein
VKIVQRSYVWPALVPFMWPPQFYVSCLEIIYLRKQSPYSYTLLFIWSLRRHHCRGAKQFACEVSICPVPHNKQCVASPIGLRVKVSDALRLSTGVLSWYTSIECLSIKLDLVKAWPWVWPSTWPLEVTKVIFYFSHVIFAIIGD